MFSSLLRLQSIVAVKSELTVKEVYTVIIQKTCTPACPYSKTSLKCVVYESAPN
jgi:hypothetical protein